MLSSQPGTADELRAAVAGQEWFHSIDLGHGIVTRGRDESARKLGWIGLPDDLRGRTLLDVGAWDGSDARRCSWSWHGRSSRWGRSGAERRVASRAASRCARATSWRFLAAPKGSPRPRARSCAGGIRVRRETLSGIDALTPSERRIAELAADGASNAEIAKALFLTVKSVEMHLTRTYRKARHRRPCRARGGAP